MLVARLEWIELLAGSVGSWLLALIMGALTAGVILYTIVLALDAPQVAGLANGPLAFGTTFVLGAQAVAMALLSALALVSARRGRLAVIG